MIISKSVALCTYNGEKFINKQLESILTQSLFIDEVIVCDDESSDSSVILINEIISRYPNRVKLIQNTINLGAIKSFEKCIKACSGDVIFLSDQDDIWNIDKAERQVQLLLSDENALAVFSNGNLIDENGSYLGNTLWEKWGFTSDLQAKWQNNDFVFSELLMNRNVITGATLVFKKELLPHLFPFKLPLGYWHDAWIGLIAAGFGGLRFLKEPTILYRIHQQQQVGITSGAGDKKFNHVSKEEFLQNIISIFPAKKALIYTRKRYFLHKFNIIKRLIRGIIRIKGI